MAEVRIIDLGNYRKKFEVFITKSELEKALRQQGDDDIHLRNDEYCLTLSDDFVE